MSIVRKAAQVTAIGLGVITTVVSASGTISAFFNPVRIAPAHASPPTAVVADQLFDTFKSTCYDLMPETAAVERHATASGWTAITGLSLRMLMPQDGAKSLKAWQLPAVEGRAAMTVVVSISDISAELADATPDFAKSDVYGCSVIPGAIADHDALGRNIAGLIGRAHDGVNDAGSLQSHDWVGQNATLSVILSHYRPKQGAGAGMLAMLALTK
ncbi:MAG: hypothetical protein ACK4MF_01055 [Hyphomicrobiaceae bacterium]